MSEKSPYSHPPVSYTNLQRLLKQATDFGQTVDEVLGIVLTKVEATQASQLTTEDIVSAMEFAHKASNGANSYIGAPHGKAGLLSVPAATDPFSPNHFHAGRNVMLPIGMQLLARFRNTNYEAIVTSKGIHVLGNDYATPTAAAVALKLSLDVDRKAAQTNGWTFWMYEEEPGSGHWWPLSKLRTHQTGTTGTDEEDVS